VHPVETRGRVGPALRHGVVVRGGDLALAIGEADHLEQLPVRPVRIVDRADRADRTDLAVPGEPQRGYPRVPQAAVTGGGEAESLAGKDVPVGAETLDQKRAALRLGKNTAL